MIISREDARARGPELRAGQALMMVSQVAAAFDAVNAVELEDPHIESEGAHLAPLVPLAKVAMEFCGLAGSRWLLQLTSANSLDPLAAGH